MAELTWEQIRESRSNITSTWLSVAVSSKRFLTPYDKYFTTHLDPLLPGSETTIDQPKNIIQFNRVSASSNASKKGLYSEFVILEIVVFLSEERLKVSQFATYKMGEEDPRGHCERGGDKFRLSSTNSL
jgi:hypothetical protein